MTRPDHCRTGGRPRGCWNQVRLQRRDHHHRCHVPDGKRQPCVVEDRGGKRHYWLSLRELLESGRTSILTTDEGPRSDDDIEIAIVVLDSLEPQQLSDVAAKAAHVRELLTGYKSGTPEITEDGEPRPQYQPTIPITERYAAKAKEVNREPRTVERWVAAYRDHGEAGLASVAQRKPEGRTDPRWIATAIEVIVENAQQSRPNRKNIFRQTEHGSQFNTAPESFPSRRRQPLTDKSTESTERYLLSMAAGNATEMSYRGQTASTAG